MISLSEIGLRYPERDTERGAVLHDINADIPSGAFRWILGPSGAGKSSLLRLLSLSMRPTSGRLVVMGVPVMRARRAVLAKLRRSIGVVFQDLRLLQELTVFDNVALRLRLDRLPEDRVELEVTEMLRFLGLGRKLHVRPHSLSGGEQQRVAVARAVVHRPPLLLADEPTGALDEPQALRLVALFEEMHLIGSTVLVSTHNEALVRRFAHPALHLERGRLISRD